MDLSKLKDLLVSKNLTISCAESITCGNIQKLLWSVSGSSNFLVGGITAYNIDQKVKLLKVDREHASSVNCVSQRVADEMAINVCKLFWSNIGLSSTGYAESYIQEWIEEPMAYYSICINNEIIRNGKITKKGLNRVQFQEYVAEFIVGELINYFS